MTLFIISEPTTYDAIRKVNAESIKQSNFKDRNLIIDVCTFMNKIKGDVNSPQLTRFLGIQANSSSLNPEELNNCGILQQENFDAMTDQMIYLMDKFHFRILGGCCGTNDLFIEKLAAKLK